jgi:hypothetical protein
MLNNNNLTVEAPPYIPKAGDDVTPVRKRSRQQVQFKSIVKTRSQKLREASVTKDEPRLDDDVVVPPPSPEKEADVKKNLDKSPETYNYSEIVGALVVAVFAVWVVFRLA